MNKFSVFFSDLFACYRIETYSSKSCVRLLWGLHKAPPDWLDRHLLFEVTGDGLSTNVVLRDHCFYLLARVRENLIELLCVICSIYPYNIL